MFNARWYFIPIVCACAPEDRADANNMARVSVESAQQRGGGNADGHGADVSLDGGSAVDSTQPPVGDVKGNDAGHPADTIPIPDVAKDNPPTEDVVETGDVDAGLDAGPVTPPPAISGWAPAPAAVPWPAPPPASTAFLAGLPVSPALPSPPATAAGHTGKRMIRVDDRLWIADTDRDRVVAIDLETGLAAIVAPVGSGPEQVAAYGDAIFVTVRRGGSVVRLDRATGAPLTSRGGFVEPYGVAPSPDLARLYVSDRSAAHVAVLDGVTLQPIGDVTVPERPRSLAVNDAGVVFVVHERGAVTRLGPTLESPGLEVLSLVTLRTSNPSDLARNPGVVPDAIPRRALGLAVEGGPDGRAFVPHAICRPRKSVGVVTSAPVCSSPAYYGAVCEGTPTPSILEPGIVRPVEFTVSAVGTVLTQTVAALPVAAPFTGEAMTAVVDSPVDAAIHPAGYLFVVGSGTDNLAVLSLAAADPMVNPVALVRVGESPLAVQFSADGARAYVLDEQGLGVSEIELAGLLALPPLQPAPSVGLERTRVLHFADDTLAADSRTGRRLFQFARHAGLSPAGSFSCATCHVEGGEDGLTWDTAHGPRQTIALAGRLADTAPYNWKGTELLLESNVQRTVKRLGGDGLETDELLSLAGYIRDRLPLPPNPYTASADAAAVARGRVVFEDPQVGCSGCHSGPASADGATHDVGTWAPGDVKFKDDVTGAVVPAAHFSTPSLRGVALTAPYFHDGSASSLLEVIDRTAAKMGVTLFLTDPERLDLVTYLMTL